jgi:hypothetical protein
MKFGSTSALCLASTLLSVFAAAQSPSRTPIKGIGVDERLDSAPLLAPVVAREALKAPDVGAFVRLIARWSTVDEARTTGRWEGVDARLDAEKQAAIPVLFVIEDAPVTLDRSAGWPEAIRAVAAHLRGRVAGIEIDVPRDRRPEAATYAFFLKLAAVQIRSVDPGMVLAQTPIGNDDAAWEDTVYASDVAAAVDVVPVEPGASAAIGLIRRRDPTAVVMTVGLELDASASAAARQWLTEAVGRLGDTPPTAACFTGSSEGIAASIAAARGLKDLFGATLLTLDPTSVSLTMLQNGADASGRVPHRLLYDVQRGSTFLVYWDVPSASPALSVTLVDQSGRRPTIRDAIRREIAPVPDFSYDAATRQSRFDVRPGDGPIVVDFNYGATSSFVSSADVSTTASLSVEEIVFRNQEAEATLAARYRTYSATLETRFHFRPSATQIFDVVSENRIYAAPDSVEWEELSFSVNGAKWGANRPAFPLLQAEKVLSRPLDLRLTTDYRYRLAGVEVVDEHRCYAIDFEPVDALASRYRGRIWIDTTSFLRVRVNSVQTHLEGAIVSNEITETYAPVAMPGGPPLQFVTHLKTRQILFIAGRNLLVEKDDWYSDFQVDAPDFDARRSAARASNRIMYRDTDRGIRYLVTRNGERVVSEQLTRRSKALAMGTRVDPTFAYPLPILGINYLNFDFLGTNSQMAMLFGGVFVAGNLQKPRLGRTPLDGSVDFFGIAVPGTNQTFTAAGEDLDARVMSIPASTGANLGWQFTPFQKVTFGYQLIANKYFAPPDATGDFVIPSSTVSHGVSGAYEFKRQGYSVGASGAVFHRMTWKPWGRAGDYDPSQQTYQLYSAGAAKDFLPGPFQSIHAGVSWFGGRNLDRFSMYQFDLFSDVQMHGVPASGVRFPSVVIARGSYSLNVFEQYKLDLFLDQAFGRDPNDRTRWRPVTGTGVSVTFRAPWNTLFTADVGKSFPPDIYRSAGSLILQFMLLKPL